MKLPVLKGIIFAALFASAVPIFIAAPAPARIVAGILLSYVLPGFVFLVFFGERERPVLDDFFLPVVISPIILSLLVLAFHAAGYPLYGAVRASTLVLLGLLAIGLLKDARAGSPGIPGPTGAIILTCALFAGAVLVLFISNPFLLTRADAWYHASILNEIVDRGLPPKEPLLPDVPLHYMWIYHLSVASSMQLTGLSVFPALGLFNVMTALVFPYLIFRLTSFFSRRRRDLVATPAFAVSGLASAAWILWPLTLVRALINEEHPRAEFIRLLREIDINSAYVNHFLSPFETTAPFGNYMASVFDKFATITAFGFGLNVFLLCFIVSLSVGFERRFAFKALVTALVLMLGALLFHVVVGMFLILSVIGAGMLLILYRLVRRRGGIPVFHAFVLPGAAVLAAIGGFSYVTSLTEGSATGGGAGSFVHFGIRNIVTIVLPLAIVFRPARKALAEISSIKTPAYTILAAWVIALLVCNVFIDLSVRNESKFVFPLFFLLFPPVLWKILDGIETARGRHRMLLVSWTAFLFLVPLVLTYRGFILDRPGTECELRRHEVTPDERKVFEWLQDGTQPNSVILGSSICDLMPVYAHRRDFYPDIGIVEVFGYSSEKVLRYKAMLEKVYSGTALDETDVATLKGAGIPFYVVVWEEDTGRVPREQSALDARPDRFELVYRNAGGRVYYIKGT